MLYTGTKVTLSGSIINFALGTSYAWSVFAGSLIRDLGWSNTAATLPYTIMIFVFAVVMAFAGRFQDRVGPRYGTMLSGIFTGAAFLLCALTLTPLGLALSFGLLYGAGIAFGYSAVTPAAIQWFPPERRGLITGIVVTSHGIAAVALSPIINSLLAWMGVRHTFLLWGFLMLILILFLSRNMSSPTKEKKAEIYENAASTKPGREPSPVMDWKQTIREPAFIILWLMMTFSAGTGLMLVANLVPIAEINYQLEAGYLLVSVFAVFSAMGRFGGGLITDRAGYLFAMKTVLLAMTFSMALYLVVNGWLGVILATVFFGFSYGSLFTVFPAAVAELFGLENFGLHYGMLFTAVGIGGGLGPFVSSYLADLVGSYNPAFFIGLFACSLALVMVFSLRRTDLYRSQSSPAR